MGEYMSDTFTGTNGDPLGSDWSAGTTGSGSSTSIQGNRGRWAVGTGLVSRYISSVSQDDGLFTFSYWPNGGYLNFLARHNTTAMDRNTCYAFKFPTVADQNVGIVEATGYGGTWDQTAFSVTGGNKYNAKVSIFSTEMAVTVWADGDSEPSPQRTLSDSSITTGYMGIYVGYAGSSGYVDIDDFVWGDGQGGSSVPGNIMHRPNRIWRPR